MGEQFNTDAMPFEEIEEVKLAQEATPEAEDNAGTIRISDDVISVVAGITIGEIKGVATAGTSLAEMFGAKKNVTKGVRVNTNGKEVVIDLYVTVVYGMKIPDIAWEVQERVKGAVESMTGMSVSKVNIHVEGVDFEKETRKEPIVKPNVELVQEVNEEIVKQANEEITENQ